MIMESYVKMNKIYHRIQEGEIETVAKAKSRASIEHYRKGFEAGFKRGESVGFSKGYSRAIKNNFL